jgi:hypothetical protein
MGARVVAITGATAALVALVVVYVVAFLAGQPAPVSAATSPAGARLTLQTVATIGHAPHPDWVSYLAADPQGHWHHSTIFKVPAHSLVTVTIYQYDTPTGLRNAFYSRIQGTTGGSALLDGKTVQGIVADAASHTFTIPDLGVSVPLAGVDPNAKNTCSTAPCTPDQTHTTITFSFRTGAPGTHRWQCLVPCGAGFVFGNGGPMQTIGYMDGLVKVG